MPYPMLTPLPNAPARVTDPNNFVSESAVFLNSLPLYRTQSNTLVSYINNITYNYNNLGTIVGVNPTKPIIPDVSGIVIGGTGVQYVSSIDVSLFTLQGGSAIANSIGAYVDAVNAAQGAAPSIDGNLPDISSLTEAPTRAMVRNTFNSVSSAFITSNLQQSISAKMYLDYVELKNFGNDDFGLITDNNITEVFNCGDITDTTITL